ncbi:hypothetical protein LTR10_018556 [Elasticomyces elasticus]|uniref:Clr5 domain-containing protein n=1 Tax=Exophiala sideris TaxID=1016849 RepID=A0ABR0JNG7_9EURO|nr:hypothetical protein LTR10_018556 [Elasticomyces elasticus]KAK5038037.1 hypothetical protein LTS07_001505 [Exophiala sideris]KAK5044019.1 hypothetical protein LTR13_000375 [Exophiala sideris]KAK5067518.1 hypothetical protein LTR69_001507 [Exophiala sideris]KAK5184244.1 hypothetical protein LTR44_003750 [Eurotiomycetes sp. CCFEE 6388]
MRYWTPQEEQAMRSFLHARKEVGLLKPAEVISLEAHLKDVTKAGHTILTFAQIKNKLQTMTRQAKVSTQLEFLRSVSRASQGGIAASPEVDSSTIEPTEPSSKEPSTPHLSPCVGAQKAGGDDGAVGSTERERSNVSPVPLSEPLSSTIAILPLSSSMMFDKHDVPNSIPASTSWEARLARYFRDLASNRGYDAPADHDWVVEKMGEIFGFLNRGVRRFQDAQHSTSISMHVVVLQSDLVQLTRLLVPAAPDDSLLTYLRALCARSPVVRRYLPGVYAAAAIYQWIFCCTFEEDVEHEQGTYFGDVLTSLAHVVRKLKTIKYLDYLETTVRPTLSAMAEVSLSRLGHIFSSLVVDVAPALFSTSNFISQSLSLQKDFRLHVESEKSLRMAFLEAFT